jgi:hypothetical protein
MTPTFWLEGLSIADFVWELSPEEHFWKITLKDSLVRRPLYHLFIVGLVWILDMLFIQMLYKFWMVKIRNKHSYKILYFSNNMSLIFRSVRYCSNIGRFNCWMYINFGYVILMMMIIYRLDLLNSKFREWCFKFGLRNIEWEYDV